jgi:arylsulfatase/uncharacterized sulfatase
MEDPGESRDLAGEMPQHFQQMLSAYEHYTRENEVLPIPPGYDHLRQLMLNTLHVGLREPFIIALLLLLLLLPFYIGYRVKRESD